MDGNRVEHNLANGRSQIVSADVAYRIKTEGLVGIILGQIQGVGFKLPYRQRQVGLQLFVCQVSVENHLQMLVVNTEVTGILVRRKRSVDENVIVGITVVVDGLHFSIHIACGVLQVGEFSVHIQTEGGLPEFLISGNVLQA